jgi:hypothetical protein
LVSFFFFFFNISHAVVVAGLTVVLLQRTEIVGLGMLLSLDVRGQTGGKEGGSKNGSAGGVGNVLKHLCTEKRCVKGGI